MSLKLVSEIFHTTGVEYNLVLTEDEMSLKLVLKDIWMLL